MCEDEIIHRCCHCFRCKDQHGEYNDNIVIDHESQWHGKEGYYISDGVCPVCLKKHYGIEKGE